MKESFFNYATKINSETKTLQVASKKYYRNHCLQKRSSLTPQDIELGSYAIAKNVCKYLSRSEHNIHVFLPITSKNEVDTYPLIQMLSAQSKQIIVSKTYWKTKTMQPYIYNPEKIRISRQGIPEPYDGISFAIEKLDVVIVPLLISDNQGHRVGYGKGFYDRFLAKCSCRLIGVNFFPPVKLINDVNKHDITLDYLITPLNS